MSKRKVDDRERTDARAVLSKLASGGKAHMGLKEQLRYGAVRTVSQAPSQSGRQAAEGCEVGGLQQGEEGELASRVPCILSC